MKYFKVEYIERGTKGTILVKALDKNQAAKIGTQQVPGRVVSTRETSKPFSDVLKDTASGLGGLFGGSGVKLDSLIAAIDQLSVMVDAGIPINDAIREVAASSESPRLQEMFTQIEEDLNAGLSLSNSVA